MVINVITFCRRYTFLLALKLYLILILFYNCNNSVDAGAELKKHAALSTSQSEYKNVDLESCIVTRLGRIVVSELHMRTKPN